MHRYISRVIDLLDPAANRLPNFDLNDARRIILSGDPRAIRAIEGSFAIVASEGNTVRMARSMDRTIRYFLAKRHKGPALFVAARIDTLHRALQPEGLAGQFHPSYTRMVPAHYLVEIALIGCPDPDPSYRRFFTPTTNALSASTEEIGRLYVSRMAQAVERWLAHIEATSASHAPIGVAF